MAAKNAVFATPFLKRPSIYGPDGRLRTTGPGGERGGGAAERFDDMGEQADQKVSMEMLGRRAVRAAQKHLRRARELD